MKKGFLLIGMIACGLIAAWAAAKQAPTPPPIIIKNEQGEQAQLYANSYALLIGVSDYTNGWRSLPGVKDDIAAVKAALTKHGFEVATLENPTGKSLRAQFDGFIKKHARDFDNRIVIYFAGHGATLTFADGRAMGYVVPADAPTPTDDQAGFEDVALDMQTIETYAKQIRSKHALFVFDSCFSGSVFYVTRSSVPPVISYKASKPVRQLITSGSETENVPDVSIFREQFVAALNGEGSDLNGDGYLTGEELGLFLEDTVINYSNDTQHPQYGKIRDPKLDKGDVVFALPKAAPPASTPDAPDAPQVTFSLDDAAVVPESWRQYAEQMSAAFAQAREYDAQPRHTAAKKAAAWQKFVTAFAADNVYDTQDEEMRRFARERISYWQQPTPRPSQEGNTELPSEEGPGVGSCWENETAGAECREDATGMEFVYVPGGCFQMGSNDGSSDEKPVHKVCLDGFWMGKYEVTQAQWENIMGENPSHFKGEDRPVETVSWNDAQAFLKQLNATHPLPLPRGEQGGTPLLGGVGGGWLFRLPSEAEWEYAARAGTTTPFFFGETISADQANYDGNYTYGKGKKGVYRERTTDVGSFPPNDFGLYDMHGNVWEWVADTYHENYKGAPNDGSVWGKLGDKKAKVLRGGSWSYYPYGCRSAARGRSAPDNRNNNIGARVVVGAR